MAEMDIYMRRRLVALGGLVAFFIFFVLLVKSCGGDDEPTTTTTTAPVGASGEAGAALTVDAFIDQADAICGPANIAVSEIDPADPNATQQEYEITNQELTDLQSLQLAESDADIDKFISDLSAVVKALRQKAQAVKNEDVVAQDAAQLDIDTAEVEARDQGKAAGFRECGAFLDAGEDAPSGGGGGNETTDTADTGTVAPTDSGAVTPAPAPETPAPTPAPTDPNPADPGGGGGITP